MIQNQGRDQNKLPSYAHTEVEAASAGPGDAPDMSMLDVNDLANCVMPPNLQSNNPGADTVDPNQAMSQPPASGASGQLVRRLPPQHVAKLRLQQGSTTTASAGPSATPQQIAGSRDAARQVDNASQGGKASKVSGQGQYVKQTGPLSDLIMTSPSTLAPS